MAGGTLAVAPFDPRTFDWQPTLTWTQPWRWWSAAWVHWSESHRWANLAGTLLLAALGWRAGCDRLDGLAWLIAWPLTHLGLLLQPALAHYGGLSGVLHAGVLVLAVSLWQRERGMRRAIAVTIVLAAALKVGLEQPWRGAVQRVPGWDIPVAPVAHLSGVLTGACCGLAAAQLRQRSARGRGSIGAPR